MINTDTMRDILEAIRCKSDPIALFEEHIDFKEYFRANDGREYLVQSIDNESIEMSVVSSSDLIDYHYARQTEDEDTGELVWSIYSPETNDVVLTLDGDSSWVKVAEEIYKLDTILGLTEGDSDV